MKYTTQWGVGGEIIKVPLRPLRYFIDAEKKIKRKKLSEKASQRTLNDDWIIIKEYDIK